MTRTMYDGVNPFGMPKGAPLYAGYVGGRWPTFHDLPRIFPGATYVSIAVNSSETAQVLDVESGDATPADVPGWVMRVRAQGIDCTVYCSTSVWPLVCAALSVAGVPRPHWWEAHYDGVAVLSQGSVAKQFANGSAYDTSVVADYWPGVDPAPRPALTWRYQMLVYAEGLDALAALTALSRRVGVVTTSLTEAQTAVSRGDPVVVVGGPAAKNLGVAYTAGQVVTNGHTTVAVGTDASNTLTLAMQVIHP